MAKKANENTNAPSEDDVQQAVANIEQNYTDLLPERGIYTNKCRGIGRRPTVERDRVVAEEQTVRFPRRITVHSVARKCSR